MSDISIRLTLKGNVSINSLLECSDDIAEQLPQDMIQSDKDQWFKTEILPHEQALRAWLNGNFRMTDHLDDIVQESYMRVLKAYDIRKIETPRAYLFTTARNVAIDVIKLGNKFKTESLEEDESKFVSIDTHKTSQEWVRYEEEVDLLKKAVMELPPKCRKIFVLRRFKGLPSADIAKRMGISTHTVSAQLTIGLKKCEEFFERANRNHSEIRNEKFQSK